MGRRLRVGQSALMRNVLPQLELDLQSADLTRTFFQGAAELRLEIGFGGGEHLIDHAMRRPEVGFIGCEPFRNGVAKTVLGIAEAGLDNVRLHADEAASLLDALPDGCLGRVDLLYPDPWPKRRQRKRRFLSDAMLDKLGRVMAIGAMLRFATDIDDYAGWTLVRVMRSRHFAWTAEEASDWQRPWPDWPSTRYEAKALREGRSPVYLTFLRRG